MWHRKLSNQLHQTFLTINSQVNNICHVLQFCFYTGYLPSPHSYKASQTCYTLFHISDLDAIKYIH